MKLFETITWPFKTAFSSPGTASQADEDGLGKSLDAKDAPADAPAWVRSAFGAARTGLRRLIAAISPVQVAPAQRQHLAGLVFIGAGPFVQAVARALDECPGLSPVPAITAASLRLRQARAYGWLQLRAALSRALSCAAENHVYEQGLAVEEAMQVVQALRNQQQGLRLCGNWPPSPELEHRRLVLGPALAVLAARSDGKREVRKRTATTLAQAAGKPKRTSPARPPRGGGKPRGKRATSRR